MGKAAYAVGDYVFLVNGPVRTGRPDGEFQIVGRLPDADGQAQYRVQSRQESFERRVVAGEIDMERSAAPKSDAAGSQVDGGGRSWLKSSSIRVHK